MSINPFDNIVDFGRRRGVEGVARHVFTALFALLAQRGYVADSDSAELIQMLSGLTGLLVMAYLSWRDKQKSERVIEAASALPPSAPREAIESMAKASSS